MTETNDGSAPREASEPQFRVAVVGAGPAGFYATDALLKLGAPKVSVDLFERLAMPYGLVRYGVAPDHQKIKSVTRAFDRTMEHPRFRLFANVSLGHDLGIDELRSRYDAVVLAMGCETDRKLGIPGEDLIGCYPATRFVAWYNGHPDFRDYGVKLDAQRAIVIGAGDVSMDITRMLVQRPEDLRATDIAPYALAVFAESRIKKVTIVARRGPAQTPFALKELKDIVDLPNVCMIVDAAPVEAALADSSITDSTIRRKLEFLHEIAKSQPAAQTGPDQRSVELLFLRSPTRIDGDERAKTVQLEKNALSATGNGLAARGTGQFETIEAGLVFPAVGYRGVPMPDVSFEETRGVIPNLGGRVTTADGTIVPRLYTAGWIKRGPSGVIGTNKADANETVKALIEDLTATPTAPSNAQIDIAHLLRDRGVRVITLADWQRIDVLETQRGAPRQGAR
jgi:ferredoxin--NADP+ reductase